MKTLMFSADEWKNMAENAHRYCFAEIRPSDMDRISYALMGVDGEVPTGYVTVRELDSESVYWQYGGAFKSIEKSINVLKTYQGFINRTKEMGVKRISTYIQNTNLPMLKMAMHCGFRIIGTRTFKNEIFCELINELDNA